MKVLHVTRDFPPRNHGGLSSAVAGWLHAHEAAGIPGAVISFDAYRPKRGATASATIDAGPPRVLHLDGPPSEGCLRSFAEAELPTLVHLHDGFLLEPARTLCTQLDLPLVLSVHVLQHELMACRGLDTPTASAEAEVRAVRHADWLTAPSPSALASLANTHSALPEARSVLPLVIAPATTPVATERPAPPRVLFAGRFSDVKGVREFLQAAVAIGAQRSDVHFELAGGLPASPKAQRRFEAGPFRQAREVLGERLRALGWCDEAALDAAYRRAHVLVAPSWSETFGQCAFEALARGTPVVTSRVGAYGDYLEPGRECLQVPPRDPAALASSVLALLDDPQKAQGLGHAGVHSAGRFAPGEVGRMLTQLYEAATRTQA